MTCDHCDRSRTQLKRDGHVSDTGRYPDEQIHECPCECHTTWRIANGGKDRA
jgi:hypothetical protein